MSLTPTFRCEANRQHYRRTGQWRDVSLAAEFERTCRSRGDTVAIVDGQRRLTFSDWRANSAVIAGVFRSLGLGRGDVVAYQLPNWWEAAVVFLAAARIGAIVNPVLPILRERELRFMLAASGAAALVLPAEYRGFDHADLAATLRPKLPNLRHVLVARGTPLPGMQSLSTLLSAQAERSATEEQSAQAERSATEEPSAQAERSAAAKEVDPDELLMLMYTSGTTAEPKGVLHSHNTLMAEVRSLVGVHGLSTRDVTLMPSPLTHISGVVHAILSPAMLGTRAVLMDRWEPASALALMANERVTYMVGAPTFLQDLAAHPDRDQHDLSAFRLFSCGGASVSADLIRRARAHLPCIAKRVYGSTEFPTITTTSAADAEQMGIETEGRPISPVELRIVDDSGRPRAVGEEGEVQARGAECFVGYADPSMNDDAFTPDGWFRTGDLGRVDAAGYLTITGRLKDIVIRKGEKFSVREIEELIARHPDVREVAVIAIPDSQTGERACAVVSVTGGIQMTLPELTEFLGRQGLAKQKWPEELVVLPDLPRTDSGKLHRAAIKQSILARSSS